MLNIGDAVYVETQQRTGVIRAFNNDFAGVEFDKQYDGHDLKGTLTTNTGWWVRKEHLIKKNKFNVGDEVLFDEFPQWLGVIKYITMVDSDFYTYFVDFLDPTFKGNRGFFTKPIISTDTGWWCGEINLKLFER